MRTLFILLAVLAITACSGNKGSADDHGAAAAAGESVQQAASEGSAKPMDRDMAEAEARKMGLVKTKPAVETADLREAPGWMLNDLDGNPVESTIFDGNVVILNFWATWCGPCKMEIPDFKRLYDTYKDQGVAIVGVAMDREGVAKVAPFVSQAQINYPIVIGNQKIAMDFGPITAIPVTYVLSQDGKIYKRYIGARPGVVFEQDIKSLLGIKS